MKSYMHGNAKYINQYTNTQYTDTKAHNHTDSKHTNTKHDAQNIRTRIKDINPVILNCKWWEASSK